MQLQHLETGVCSSAGRVCIGYLIEFKRFPLNPNTQLCCCAPNSVDNVVQWAINRKLPLCKAVLPGTHNSGISLADGYGNLDLQFQDYFKWISWVVSRSIDRQLIQMCTIVVYLTHLCV